jgi:hypothetical protein
MKWVFLSALANRWLWLLAVFATAVLLATGRVPAWSAGLAGVVVLIGGAAVDTAQQYRRAHGPAVERSSRRELPRVRDEHARGYLRRAVAAVARLDQARTSLGEASTDVSADVHTKAAGMLDALGHTGEQVDRLAQVLQGFDERQVRAELADVEYVLDRDPAVSRELAEERTRTRDGLRAQLASMERLRQQQTLALEKMRATAVGIEGLSVRVGEISALYESTGQVDTTGDDLHSVTTELEELRLGLIDAQRSLRAVLSGTDVPGLDGGKPPPDS